MTHTGTDSSALAAVLAACAALLIGGCGGGGGGGDSTLTAPPAPPPEANLVSVVVDAGPMDPLNPGQVIGTLNTPFVSVTICAPGTSNCQTIDHVSVDTGSSGLRVISSILTSSLAGALTQATDTQGQPLAECLPFADGYSWGSVKLADAQIGGEKAANISIQVIGDPAFATVPADCSSGGATQEDTVSTFGANGILGIAPFKQDCGSQCVTQTTTPQLYYGCATPSSCLATTVALASQVWNPVALFVTDNNGTILQLPTVGPAGAASTTGTLFFGIDTQSNNALGTATVLAVDPNTGNLTVTFENQTLSSSFIDSGSNGYFFPSSLARCTDPNESGFYCPATPQSLTATITSNTGVMSSVSFSVANANALFTSNESFVVFNDLGGTNSVPQSFDFGLPFFLGRKVFTAIEQSSTSAGQGPFIAY